jgi:hypothetical protein
MADTKKLRKKISILPPGLSGHYYDAYKGKGSGVGKTTVSKDKPKKSTTKSKRSSLSHQLTPTLSGIFHAGPKKTKDKSSKVMSKSGADLDRHKVDRTVKKSPDTPKMRGYKDRLAITTVKTKPKSILMSEAIDRREVGNKGKRKDRVTADNPGAMAEAFRKRLGGN